MHNTLRRKATLAAVFHRGDGFDMRSKRGKRFHQLVLAHLDRLDHDADESEMALIKTCAAQRVSLETLEQGSVSKGVSLNGTYLTLSRALERNEQTLRTRTAPCPSQPATPSRVPADPIESLS